MRAWNVVLIIAALSAGMIIKIVSDDANINSSDGNAASATRVIGVMPIDHVDEQANRVFQPADYG